MPAYDTNVHSRARTEHLVDRVLASLLPAAVEATRSKTIRLLHQAREARRAGDPRRSLDTLASLELASAPRDLACWAFREWLAAAEQLTLPSGTLLYRAATGQAAALEPTDSPNCLRVVTALGLSWEPGRILSRRCLRGLTLLSAGRPRGTA